VCAAHNTVFVVTASMSHTRRQDRRGVLVIRSVLSLRAAGGDTGALEAFYAEQGILERARELEPEASRQVWFRDQPVESRILRCIWLTSPLSPRRLVNPAEGSRRSGRPTERSASAGVAEQWLYDHSDKQPFLQDYGDVDLSRIR
jgi:hypothetical protein